MRSIISIIMILLAGALFFVYTKGAYDQIQATQVMNTQYDVALNKAAQLQQVVQTLLSKYNSFNPADLARLQTMLPDSVNNIGLILDLDTLAHQYGLSLEGVDIGGQGTGGSSAAPASATVGASGLPYDSLDVTFTIHGTYGQFIQLIDGLQQSLRIVDLVNLDVSGASSPSSQTSTLPSLVQPVGATAAAGPDSNIYAFGVTLRTYWLK